MNKLGWKAGLLTMAALLMAAAPARAQDTLESHIPFDFVAGKTTLPAGNYEITRPDPMGPIQIRDTAGRHSVFLLTVGTRADEAQQPELVFARVADRYFLLRVDDGTNTAQQITIAPATVERAAEHVALAMTR